ncbi:MAG: hypothetical protein HZA54_12910 [Planctomycetes bacterium]|nr:hypothetical protein [Planctomycetota bacterium]
MTLPSTRPARRPAGPDTLLRPALADLVTVATAALAAGLDQAAARLRLAALTDAARALLDVGASEHVADSLAGWTARTRQTTQRMAAAPPRPARAEAAR